MRRVAAVVAGARMPAAALLHAGTTPSLVHDFVAIGVDTGTRHSMMRVPRGNSSVGRARPCQGRGREFESRFPLQIRETPVRRGFVFEPRAAGAGHVHHGLVAEWSCSGLQIRVRRFDSDPSLHAKHEPAAMRALSFPAACLTMQARCPDGEIGSRKGLKIPRPQGHPGSSPGPGTSADPGDSKRDGQRRRRRLGTPQDAVHPAGRLADRPWLAHHVVPPQGASR